MSCIILVLEIKFLPKVIYATHDGRRGRGKDSIYQWPSVYVQICIIWAHSMNFRHLVSIFWSLFSWIVCLLTKKSVEKQKKTKINREFPRYRENRVFLTKTVKTAICSENFHLKARRDRKNRYFQNKPLWIQNRIDFISFQLKRQYLFCLLAQSITIFLLQTPRLPSLYTFLSISQYSSTNGLIAKSKL